MFTPFAFVKQAPAAGGVFNPEIVSNLYYWWDFTDSGSMTFSSGTTIASVSNKATRTSGNETLNAINGAPYFVNSTTGSRFTASDSISNTSVAGTGGDLDTLFSGSDATVIWIGNLAAYDTATDIVDNNVLWGAAGSLLDDLRFSVMNRTSGLTASSCSVDNAISSTYQYQIVWHDYFDSRDPVALRTYSNTMVGVNSFVAYTVDYTTLNYTSIGIRRDNQAISTSFVPAIDFTGGPVSNLSTGRGFKINACSRTGSPMSANQNIQHLLIYNGVLSNTDITTIYNNWVNSL